MNTYNPEICNEKHKRIDEQLAVHDRRFFHAKTPELDSGVS